MSNQVFGNTSGTGVRYTPNVQVKDRLASSPQDPGTAFTLPATLPPPSAAPPNPAAPTVKYALGFDTLNGIQPTTVAGPVTRANYTNGQNDFTAQYYTITASSSFQNSAVQVTSLVDNVLAVNFCLPFGLENAVAYFVEMWVAVYPPGYSQVTVAPPYLPTATYGAVSGSFQGNNVWKQPLTSNCIVPLPAGYTMCFEFYGQAAGGSNLRIGTYKPWQVSVDIMKLN